MLFVSLLTSLVEGRHSVAEMTLASHGKGGAAMYIIIMRDRVNTLAVLHLFLRVKYALYMNVFCSSVSQVRQCLDIIPLA